jgi:hypothetical protein
MPDQAQFEAFVRPALARYGVEVDELEMYIMWLTEQVYGPPRDALLAADLSDVPREVGLNPSRAPEEVGPQTR